MSVTKKRSWTVQVLGLPEREIHGTATVDVGGFMWTIYRGDRGLAKNLIAVCEALKLTLQAKNYSELLERFGITDAQGAIDYPTSRQEA